MKLSSYKSLQNIDGNWINCVTITSSIDDLKQLLEDAEIFVAKRHAANSTVNENIRDKIVTLKVSDEIVLALKLE